MERTGNCLNTETSNMTIDFSGFRTINDPKGFKSAGLINITRDVKGQLYVKYFNLHMSDFLYFAYINREKSLFRDVHLGYSVKLSLSNYYPTLVYIFNTICIPETLFVK